MKNYNLSCSNQGFCTFTHRIAQIRWKMSIFKFELFSNPMDNIAKTIQKTEEESVKFTCQMWCIPRYGHRRVAQMCSNMSGHSPSHVSHTHTLKQTKKNYVNARLYIYSAGNRKHRGKNSFANDCWLFFLLDNWCLAKNFQPCFDAFEQWERTSFSNWQSHFSKKFAKIVQNLENWYIFLSIYI